MGESFLKKTNSKLVLTLIISLIGAIIIGLAVSSLHSALSIKNQLENSHSKLELINDMIQQSKTDEVEITENYDAEYDSKAQTVAFMAENLANFEYSSSYMEEVRELINVDYLEVTSAEGETFSAGEVPGEEKEPREYEAPIDNGGSVKISQNSDKLQENLNANASLRYVLDDVHVGQNGFAFAVHAEKKTILYSPNEELIGEMAEDHGIDVSLMQDGADTDITIDGTTYFCSVKQIDKGLIAVAVPRSEIESNCLMTVILSIIIYGIFVAVVILYSTLLHREHVENGINDEAESKSKGKNYWYNKTLGKKLLAITLVGVVLTFALTYYIQTLFSLSQQSVTNTKSVEETLATLSSNEDTVSTQTEQFKTTNLEKVETAAYIIENTDAAALTQDYMVDLRDALGAISLEYFDANGQIVARASELWSYSLSTDENDQSYQFWQVLDGKKSELIQDPQEDDSGKLKQYAAHAIINADHQTIGMVEIGLSADALSAALKNTDFANVVSGIQVGENGFAFAINADDNTFAYYPAVNTSASLTGKNATDYGIAENQIKGNYDDFIKINGTSYYCASGNYTNYILYIAVPMASLNTTALPVALVTTGIMLVFMILLWAIFSFSRKTAVSQKEGTKAQGNKEKEMVDVDMGDGRTAKSRSITSRWSHRALKWDSKDAGGKTMTVLNIVLMAAAFIILIGVIFADSIFAEDSLVHFILKGQWQKGINIFSVTYCFLIIICIVEITAIVRKAVMWLAQSMNAKGETICRLIDNFLKLAAIIGLLYYCLGTLGVDTQTLVASAGILTLVVGLGANSLINDILAGLFIVFEGEFQVGDIVTIDGFRGTVIEIGVRTVKVKEGAGNIKVFSNRNVSNVLNMTKDYSVVALDMSIEYGEDLHYVEQVLEKEFPRIKAKLPAIVEGPFYRGVSELADSSVNIKIIAKCTEGNRVQLDRDLRRQLKLVFDKYNINIPYPQVVLNQPTEIVHETSNRQDQQADKFVNKQAEEFKNTDIKEE